MGYSPHCFSFQNFPSVSQQYLSAFAPGALGVVLRPSFFFHFTMGMIKGVQERTRIAAIFEPNKHSTRGKSRGNPSDQVFPLFHPVCSSTIQQYQSRGANFLFFTLQSCANTTKVQSKVLIPYLTKLHGLSETWHVSLRSLDQPTAILLYFSSNDMPHYKKAWEIIQAALSAVVYFDYCFFARLLSHWRIFNEHCISEGITESEFPLTSTAFVFLPIVIFLVANLMAFSVEFDLFTVFFLIDGHFALDWWPFASHCVLCDLICRFVFWSTNSVCPVEAVWRGSSVFLFFFLSVHQNYRQTLRGIPA